jgi:V/A-type H+-transporting ATPase subunit E
MSAEKILKEIKKDSEKQIKEILKEAEIKGKQIIQQTKDDAELQAEKILEKGKIQSENIKKILISKANQDTKKEIMSAQEKIIEECFNKAQYKLSTLGEKEYSELVNFLIKNGKNKFGNKCTIIASRYIDKKIAEKNNLKVTGNIESTGGIILKSIDGKITLDYTFDGILKREKDKIRIKVGKLLFSKDME